MKSKIIAIVGPTASGKSAIAYKLAKKFSGGTGSCFAGNGEILCVDSRTVYRGMDIGTGKDTGRRITNCDTNIRIYEYVEIDKIRYYGLDLVNPDQEMNGALFKEYAEKIIAEIIGRGHLPILVGGTGLWMDMIIEGRELPKVGPDLELRKELENKNEGELFEEYKKLDPAGAEVIDRKNKRRLIRALEVCKKTGRPFSDFMNGGEEKYDCLWLGVDWPMEVLEKRIDARVDEMVGLGLLDEVKKLKSQYGCGVYSMSGIGYQEICRHLNGEISFEKAIEEIKLRTRQYAKRQKTWFKRNQKIHWITNIAESEKQIRDWLR
jgi:tRNA dimethylallyltransferase